MSCNSSLTFFFTIPTVCEFWYMVNCLQNVQQTGTIDLSLSRIVEVLAPIKLNQTPSWYKHDDSNAYPVVELTSSTFQWDHLFNGSIKAPYMEMLHKNRPLHHLARNCRKEIICNHKSTWICRLFLNYCYESSLLFFPRWDRYRLNLLCVWCIGGKRQASFVVSLYCQAYSTYTANSVTDIKE